MQYRRFNEYFSFTRKERNGIIVLLFFCIFLLIIRWLVLRRSEKEISLNDIEFLAEIEKFEQSLNVKEIVAKEVYNKTAKSPSWIVPDTCFVFDPNTITNKELKKLGFSEKQISTLNNYRNKGGKFVENIDLLKIYGITNDQYNNLEPYIKINKSGGKSREPKIEPDILKTSIIVELNTGSESDLTLLSGIGELFAKRICKYRDRLGGYYSKDQILEVYGMDSTRYNLFSSQIIVDTSLIIKIDLNSIKYSELIKKPYLNKYQTRAILKFRELHGKFTKVEELKTNNLLDDDVYIKIKPYLEIK